MADGHYEEPIPSPDKLMDNPYEEILEDLKKRPPIPPRGGSARLGFSYTGPPRPRAENQYEDVPLPTTQAHPNPSGTRLPMWRSASVKRQKSSRSDRQCCHLVWWQWLIAVIYTVVTVAVVVLFILRFTRKTTQEVGRTDKLISPDSMVQPGPVGPPGPAGMVGPTGAMGAPGSNGIPGMSSTGQNMQGGVGATGNTGQPGAPGFPGSRGPPGFPGLPGPGGDPGFPGARGATGAPGLTGSDSSPGPPGFRGQPGPPGSPGSTHLNDECEQSNGGCDQVCVDMYDGYYCACREEYQLVRPTQSSCTTVPGNSIKCRNTLHGRMCWCTVTKTLLNGTSCTLRSDRCASRCEQRCISGPPVRCACMSGFTLNPDKETCSDINECLTSSTCSSNAICINSYGSHYCLDP